MQLIPDDIESYAEIHTTEESPALKKIAERTGEQLKYAGMLSGRVVAGFLKLMVRLTGARHVLELGMFTGYSALAMAEELPEGGRLTTCDNNPKYIAMARSHFSLSSHGNKIEIVEGEALESLDKLTGPFDLVFLDADKENYPVYYEIIKSKLRRQGILVIDNALWSGTVLHPSGDRKAVAIARLNDLIMHDPEVTNIFLTIRDGLNVIQKIQ